MYPNTHCSGFTKSKGLQWVGANATDGFDRSDTREALRRFFEIDGAAVALAALSSLVRDGSIDGYIGNNSGIKVI